MDKVSLGVAVVALGAAGWLGWTATDLAREVRTQTEARETLETRIAALERAAARPTAPATPPAAVLADGGPAPGAPPAPSSAASLSGSARPPTLTELERRLVSVEKSLTEVPRAPVAPPGQTIESVSAEVPTGDDRWYGSVDDAQKHLSLDGNQEAEFVRVVAETKKEIEELHKIPDADGKSWEQAQKDGVTVNGGMISYDDSKLQAFREKTIPGRSESFGAAERRIAAQGKDRLRRTLSPDQAAKFDKAHSEGLLGAGGGGSFMSIFMNGVGSDFGATLPAPPPVPEPK